jgi:hypothetical protein
LVIYDEDEMISYSINRKHPLSNLMDFITMDKEKLKDLRILGLTASPVISLGKKFVNDHIKELERVMFSTSFCINEENEELVENFQSNIGVLRLIMII